MPRALPTRRPAVLVAALIALSGAAAAADEQASPDARPAKAKRSQLDPNPCIPEPRNLLCPDLVMRAPYDLTIDRQTRPGRTLLRAANSIDSLGRGPVELRGRRSGRVTMEARQAIYRRNGSRRLLDTGAHLGFKTVPGRRYGGPNVGTFRYWKYRYAAKFELWEVGSRNRRQRLVRRGPKVYYCLRDLQRTHPGRRRSPSRSIYPACSQNRSVQRVTLGTSVGWSDIYPASYPEQWIDVTGLRGRFAYVHIADPRNGIYESDEENNESEVIIRLPSGRRLSAREGISGE